MNNNKLVMVLSAALFFLPVCAAYSEVEIIKEKYYDATMSFYEMTDFVSMGNTVTLDNKAKDDKAVYFGLIYSADFKLTCKDDGPQFYVKAQRDGPYNYDAPIIIDHTLATSTGKVKAYNESEFLPYFKEFWSELPLYFLPGKIKTGLFGYRVGHGVAVNGYYENYGASISESWNDFKWNLYYCYPDLSNKRLGPAIYQEKEQGQQYDRSKANFFASDLTFKAGESTFQPYVSVLMDHTGTRRSNLFSTPTVRDTLGTIGFSADIILSKLSIAFEMARNFGRADSDNPDSVYPDSKFVEHAGYMIYTDIAYQLEKLKPHALFMYSSGNKTTEDMVNNGDTLFTDGKNRAFNAYSPLNTNLADSIYTLPDYLPLVAMGYGNGLNYGVARPGTFSDPQVLDNLILFGTGFDCELTEKFSFRFDWWHLRSAENGVGTLNGMAAELSPDLGNEVDLTMSFVINDHITLGLLSGYFMPGKFYKEFRDDTGGSLFTPYIRGDGEADPAYQIELCCELNF
jgi:hypothetical protein